MINKGANRHVDRLAHKDTQLTNRSTFCDICTEREHAVGTTSPSASWINRQTEGFHFQNNLIYTTVINSEDERYT